MNTFQIKNRTWIAPASFDELSMDQLTLFARIQQSGKTRKEMLRTIAYRFSSIPAWYYMRLNRIQQMHIEDHFTFLFEEYTMNTWKVQKFNVGSTTYYGPDGPLKNTTGAEFAYADKHFAAFAKGKDPGELDKFIACFYRPMTVNGNWIIDMRIPFEFREIGMHAKHIRSVPADLKYAIFLNYIGVRADMVRRHPNVFAETVKAKVRSFGWPGIFYELAGDKLGTETDVQNKFIWNLMGIMEMNEVRRIEREAEIKSNS